MKTPDKYMFPYYEPLHWYTAEYILLYLKGNILTVGLLHALGGTAMSCLLINSFVNIRLLAHSKLSQCIFTSRHRSGRHAMTCGRPEHGQIWHWFHCDGCQSLRARADLALVHIAMAVRASEHGQIWHWFHCDGCQSLRGCILSSFYCTLNLCFILLWQH